MRAVAGDPTDEPAVFRDEPLTEIVALVRRRLADGVATVELEVLDPDRGRGRHAGERVEIEGEVWRHRSLRVWVDLAARLGLRLCTPRVAQAPRILLRFERLIDVEDAASDDRTEKYGTGAGFARVAKLEDPDFVLDLHDALERVDLRPGARVLELGCNRGDVLVHLAGHVPGLADGEGMVGVDHCRSALELARARLPAARFIAADLADLAGLGLGVFDLVVAFDTLQSSGLDDRGLLRTVVQRCLAADGALVLGLPNCRYLGGEVVHGARMRNFRQPELGLLVKDVAYYRKYMQQHGRTVYVTGKHELLLTAVKRRGGDDER